MHVYPVRQAKAITVCGWASRRRRAAVLLFFGFIALHDVLRWYRALSENPFGKAAIAIGFAIASNLAYALANQLVSQVVHVTPTNFLRTTLFIAVLMMPVLMTLAGGVAFAIGSAASSLIILLSMGPGLISIRRFAPIVHIH
jgi:hypothetical protein